MLYVDPASLLQLQACGQTPGAGHDGKGEMSYGEPPRHTAT